MTIESRIQAAIRPATEPKESLGAVADGVAAMILAVAEASRAWDQAFRAPTKDEILKSWRFLDIYRQKD